MFQTFESHAHQWVDRYTIAVDQHCQKSFAETPSNQSALENYIQLTSTQDNPPITPSQLTSNSNLKTNSDNLNEDEGVIEGSGIRSYEVDPKLAKPIILGSNKLIPLSPAYIDQDTDFARQDPSNVHHHFATIDKTYISLSGNLYQLREVIDYWLPSSQISEGRIKWLPSKLIEEIRIRTINELNFIQNCFTERLQSLNNSLCQLREGAFGGRFNTNSLSSVQIMRDRLKDLRRQVLRIQTPISDRSKALSQHSQWIESHCLPEMLKISDPYLPERYTSSDPNASQIVETFKHHIIGVIKTVQFCSQAFTHLSQTFEIVNLCCKTMIEGFHKLMLDLYVEGITTEFITTWAARWERVTFALLLKVLGLPALNSGLQHDFPGYDAELN